MTEREAMTDERLQQIKDRTLWPDDVLIRDEMIDELVAEVERLREHIETERGEAAERATYD